MKKPRILALFLAFTLALTGCGVSEVLEIEKQGDASQIAEENSEESGKIRPQDDFYGYVNEEALRNMTIDYGEISTNVYGNTQKEVDALLVDRMLEIATSKQSFPEGSGEYIIKKAYEQICDFEENEELQKRAADDVYERIDEILAVNSIEQLVDEIAFLNENYGIRVFSPIGVGENFHEPGTYTIYCQQLEGICGVSLKSLKKNQAYGRNYESSVVDDYIVAGLNKKAGKEAGKKLAYMALDIAWATDLEIMDSLTETLTYEYLSTEEIDNSLVNLTTEQWEKMSGVESNPYGIWGIQDIEQLIALDSKFTDENLEVLKLCVLDSFLASYSQYLYKDFDFIHSPFDMPEDEIEKNRLQYIKDAYGLAVSDVYTKAVFTDEMNADLKRICENVREGYRKKISESDWLSDPGKEALIKKLDNIVFVTGENAIDEERTSKSAVFGDDWYETQLLVYARESRESNDVIGTVPNHMIPNMSMDTVNACYNSNNTVTIPVAVMTGELYDVNRDYYYNLGTFGTTIAHEIGHGFDSDGIRWDMDGRYNPDWLPAEDVAVFEEKNKAAAEYFEMNFEVFDVYRVNGEKTLRENFADLGGLECILAICDTKEQRMQVYEGLASSWRQLAVKDVVINQIDEDPHSPAVIRVNAVLGAIDEFYDDYKVQEGDNMYIAPEKRVKRW